jgi:hypothetical protein
MNFGFAGLPKFDFRLANTCNKNLARLPKVCNSPRVILITPSVGLHGFSGEDRDCHGIQPEYIGARKHPAMSGQRNRLHGLVPRQYRRGFNEEPAIFVIKT